MSPEIQRHPDPASVAKGLEGELADAVRTRDAKGTDKLVKDQQKRLNAGVVQQREQQESLFTGIHYLGHTYKGYEYRVITDAEGHELLATAADALNNPMTKAGTIEPAATEAGIRRCRFPSGPSTPRPLWSRRPVSGFEEPSGSLPGMGHQLEPGFELLPGETLDEAYRRQRAARLHRFVLDSIRIVTTSTGSRGRNKGPKPGKGPDGQMPMLPHFTLAVTIDFKSLRGQLENAGVTDHGEDLSASNCRRLACNAGIIPVVLNGDGVPAGTGQDPAVFQPGPAPRHRRAGQGLLPTRGARCR